MDGKDKRCGVRTSSPGILLYRHTARVRVRTRRRRSREPRQNTISLLYTKSNIVNSLAYNNNQKKKKKKKKVKSYSRRCPQPTHISEQNNHSSVTSPSYIIYCLARSTATILSFHLEKILPYQTDATTGNCPQFYGLYENWYSEFCTRITLFCRIRTRTSFEKYNQYR